MAPQAVFSCIQPALRSAFFFSPPVPFCSVPDVGCCGCRSRRNRCVSSACVRTEEEVFGLEMDCCQLIFFTPNSWFRRVLYSVPPTMSHVYCLALRHFRVKSNKCFSRRCVAAVVGQLSAGPDRQTSGAELP